MKDKKSQLTYKGEIIALNYPNCPMMTIAKAYENQKIYGLNHSLKPLKTE